MAINPVKTIREARVDGAIDQEFAMRLRTVAALPPSDGAPYLTVCVDWRPDAVNPALRPARLEVDQQLEKLLARHRPHSTAGVSLIKDAARVKEFLASAADDTPHGYVIVARAASNVFEAIPLPMPVATFVAEAPIPLLRNAARAARQTPSFAVLAADQKSAMLTITRLGRAVEFLDIEGTEFPRHQEQGGWSQKGFQDRADERIEAFARRVASEVRRVLDEERIEWLVVAADEVIGTELKGEWHTSVRDRIIGQTTIEHHELLSSGAAIRAALPVVMAAAANRDNETVAKVRDAVKANGYGTSGTRSVLEALQAGQVHTLIMASDFAAPGWADYVMEITGYGLTPGVHPAGGDPDRLVTVPLEDEMVRLALKTGADVEFIGVATEVTEGLENKMPKRSAMPARTPAATALDKLGGVAAILRYTQS